MKKPTGPTSLDLPEFIKNASVRDLEDVEDIIMSVYSKFVTITKAVQESKYVKPKSPPKVVHIISRSATSAAAVRVYIKEFGDQITPKTYFETLQEIAADLEINVIANQVSFYNIKVLKHYQKVINTVLVDTKIKDVINYCLAKLHEQVAVNVEEGLGDDDEDSVEDEDDDDVS